MCQCSHHPESAPSRRTSMKFVRWRSNVGVECEVTQDMTPSHPQRTDGYLVSSHKE